MLFTRENTLIMGYEGFKELRVWQEDKELATNIYKITSIGKFERGFGLRNEKG